MKKSGHSKKKPLLIAFIGLIFLASVHTAEADSVIIDHTCTAITLIPQSAIEQAKAFLHIAYGHTSHGSQLTDGMTGLVDFSNNRGLGLNLPDNIFQWNNGGINGALDLQDYAMGGDVGYYPDWVNNTREYLGAPNPVSGRGTNNPETNLIIWSWCGQVDEKYAEGTLYSEYLTPMTRLETDYPGVFFVYMTGHVDIWDDANNKAANQTIRDFCKANDKILYDFADIERYDPDGKYFEYVNDNCDYYSSAGGALLGNWAEEWQNSHTEGVDWYYCGSAHSQPLNANLKAYAAWWLWARLAGWSASDSEDFDNDGDGYTENQGDCNDKNKNIHPGAIEICGDGIDQDCDGSDLACASDPDNTDDDGDGYTENQGDCNDKNKNIHPDAMEICGDGIDQDCDGAVDEGCGSAWAGDYAVQIQSKLTVKKVGKFDETNGGQLSLEENGTFELDDYSTSHDMSGTFNLDAKGKKILYTPSAAGLAALENSLIDWLEESGDLYDVDFTFEKIKTSRVKIDKNTGRATGKIKLNVSGTVSGCVNGEDCGETKFKYKATILLAD